MGWIYMSQLLAGRDIASGFNRIMDKLFTVFKPRRKLRVKYNFPNPEYEYNQKKMVQQDEINRILDKIGQSGYDSLTVEEKDTLFKLSKKKK